MPEGADARGIVWGSLNRLKAAMGAKDAEAGVALFEPDAMLLGTGGSSVGREAITNYVQAVIDAYDSFTWEWDEGSLEVRAADDVLWFFVVGDAVTTEEPDGTATRHPMRLTGVLRWDGDSYRWSQFHGSVPVTD